jgi:hypothetical protein
VLAMLTLVPMPCVRFISLNTLELELYNRRVNIMRIAEKITLKNLGDCIVMAEDNDTVLVSKDGVCYFVTNPTKKRQDEEYSYDTVITYGFTVEEASKLIQPLYEELIQTATKQFKIYDKLSKMLIEAFSRTM